MIFHLVTSERAKEKFDLFASGYGGWEIKRRNSILILYVSHFSTFRVFFHSALPTVNIIAGNRRKNGNLI